MNTTLENLIKELGNAVTSGSFMVAIWRKDGLRIHMWRGTNHFPIDDLDVAATLLRNDVDTELLRTRRLIIPDSTANGAS